MLYIIFFLSLFIYFEREREKERESGGGAEKEGEIIPSRPWAVIAVPDAGLRPTN